MSMSMSVGVGVVIIIVKRQFVICLRGDDCVMCTFFQYFLFKSCANKKMAYIRQNYEREKGTE